MASSRENLEEMYARLAVEEEEEEGGVLMTEEDVSRDNRFILVGRFLTERNINFLAMQNVLAALWRPQKGIEIHDIGNLRYAFVFYHVLDIQKVVEGGPWSFEQSPLVCHQLEPMEDANVVPLNKMEIWVQVHDIPTGMLSDKVLQTIGNQVGTFIKVDAGNTSGMWRQYVRIRVSLDIDKPLKRRMKIKRENGTFSWINFKYERLSTFCFVCGRIGHSDRDCEIVYASPTKTIERAYGVWLRAPNKNTQKQNLGSKWLRNGPNSGYNRAEEGRGTSTTTMHGGEGSMANFMETGGVVSEIVGGETTITVKGHNLGDTLEAGNKKFESEIVVTDTKRKRRDVEKLTENTECSESSGDISLIGWTKNGPEAGLGIQARLGQ
ncbi:hypothetical protein DCAR_0830969 [Daucus carota subsp. sativus]|uniref:CCHC-type domain-containing protein n=1 Tax=Daucus carota subsp. sativus TaxID=79200 RepID=A0AAF1BBY6_DAUCS|nr:hypothetical protein DCAR_0830969 [Daucus carota subsp. sativus]